MNLRVVIATAAALSAFAANSVLCRLALRGGHVDPATFTAVRLVSGALALAVLCGGRLHRDRLRHVVLSALALSLYAVPFSYAYLELTTGTGALLLFGSVQVTMIGWGILHGERMHRGLGLGLAIAMAGLVFLVSPGLAAPAPGSALAMIVAGAAWGAYSLRGRLARGNPTAVTATNFAVSAAFAVLLLLGLSMRAAPEASVQGLALAGASGALASGAGYSVWYYALRGLSASQAALLQLLVPVLAAAAGVLWMAEPLTMRLVLGGVAILLGVAISQRRRGL